MNRSPAFALAILFALTLAANAEDKPKSAPPPPSCGKTAEDCQKVVDSLNGQLAKAQAAAATYRTLSLQKEDLLASQAK